MISLFSQEKHSCRQNYFLFADGKGRRTTLAAITSFASLMFISTLGKDPSTGHVFDDVYGDLIQDVLEDDAGTDKGHSEDTMEKADEFDIGIYHMTSLLFSG